MNNYRAVYKRKCTCGANHGEELYIFQHVNDDLAVKRARGYATSKTNGATKGGFGIHWHITSLKRIDVAEQSKEIDLIGEGTPVRCMSCGAVLVQRDGDEGLFCPEGCII